MRYVPCHVIATAIVLSLLVLPVAANGQAGTRADPDSPAGVEYQLPLEQARENAAGPGSRGGDARSRRSVPLFGAGIVAGNSGGRASGGGSGDAGGASGGGSGGSGSTGSEGARADANGAPGSGDEVVRQAAASPNSDESSATQRIIGIAMAVLLTGTLLGILLRRGLKQPGV